MKARVWRVVPVLLAMWLLMLPTPMSSDCGDVTQKRKYAYNFINPRITAFDDELSPFFLSFGKIYRDFFKSQGEIYEVDNAREWQQRYCEQAKLEDIRYIVYSASVYELDDLRAVIDNPNATMNMLGGMLSANSWARYMVRHRCRETVDYLIFAKGCEPHVVAPADPWQPLRRDVGAMQTLIREAHERFLRTESHYIRLRYAFQAIRLAHYMQDYEQTLQLVEYYLPKIDNDPSIVEYWIMGHEAGAMQALGRLPEAAYRFSRVFDKCPGKRESAFRSFRVETDAQWDSTLVLCRNNHQRATLYALRAHGDNARLVPEMERIYEYDPKHNALEMLLVKEMQALESILLANSLKPDAATEGEQVERKRAGERVIALQGLVRKWLKQDKLEHPALWKVAQGYLEILAGNYYFAERTLAAAEELIDRKDKALQEQLEVCRLVLKIMAMETIGRAEETELADMKNDFEYYAAYPDFPRLINDKLRVAYIAQGDEGKAYLMQYNLRQLRANPDLDIIDDLLAVCRKKNPSVYEKSLITRKDGTTIKSDLAEIKASFLLGQGLPEAAMKAIRLIPEQDWDNYGQFNPFVRRFKDCVSDCRMPDSLTTYNRGEMIMRLLDMEFDARASAPPDDAAAKYFALGEAYYNMSYFGPAWKTTDLFRSSTSAYTAFYSKGRTVFAQPGLPLGNYENFNMEPAMRFFDLAARTARSPEIQAAATYMNAKCERNLSYVQDRVRTYAYFDLLKRGYNDTEFYKRVIAECKDFQAYVLK